MNLHRRSAVGALVLALGLTLAFASSILAHTGSLKASQDCAGYSIIAHLDGNVAAGATWVLKLNDSTIASGTGPGPADLGPYTGPVTVGTVEFKITFGREVNKYEATLSAPEGCTQPTPDPTPTPPIVIPCTPENNCTLPTPEPTPSPTPEATPTPEPSATPVVTPTPDETLPPTSTSSSDQTDTADPVSILAFVAFLAIVLSAVEFDRRRRSA